MIEVASVTKRFDDLVSLDDVTLRVPDGSLYGLIGTNGSGKSTLLRVMCGALRADGGSVSYDGEAVYENVPAKRGVVYLTDREYFLSGAALDDMRRFYDAVYPSFDNLRYSELTELFGLDPTRKLSGFSKGMQKQAAIILALSCRPRFLLCDETFDGLDPVMRQLFKRLLCTEAADRGMTVVISSHNLRDIEDVCDHIGVLHRGKMLFESEIDDLRREIHKFQLAYRDPFDPSYLDGLDVVQLQQSGSVVTVTARGDEETIRSALGRHETILCESVPLTLEEIFITEMGDRGYDSDQVLL